jgi:hypothetical protein
MEEKLSANVPIDLEGIMDNYSKVEKETVNFLKAKLQEQTSMALEQDIFEGYNPFPEITSEGTTGILYIAATLRSRTVGEIDYTRYLVLTDDGKLFKFKVVGEGNEEGDWTYEGMLEGEAEPRDYIKEAPFLIRKIQTALTDKQKKE